MSRAVAAAEEAERPPAAGEQAGALAAGRDAQIGGQAALEGVMMRGVSTWAVAGRFKALNIFA